MGKTKPMVRGKPVASITLNNPVERGDEQITTITLREPKGRDLRGLSMTLLMQMNAGEVAILIPRISTPALLPEEVDEMTGDDLIKFTGEVVAFLVPASELEKLRG